MTVTFKNVYPATYAKGELAFGDLAELGLMRKRYVRDGSRNDPDAFHIEWDVIGDIEFTTVDGETYKQGDTIEWGR